MSRYLGLYLTKLIQKNVETILLIDMERKINFLRFAVVMRKYTNHD